MPTLRITILTGPSKGRQHRFDRFPVVIGRSPDNSLAVIDDRASRAHLRIRQMPEGLVLEVEIEGMEIERAGLSGEMKGPRQLVEAIVVLDLCDSTVMANRYGDAFALQLKEAIRTLVRPVLADKGVAFLKGTGDGFLATFPDLHKAAEAAVWILQKKDTALPTPPMFRISIHIGPTNVDSVGDRQGDAVNMAFRLEGVNVSGFHETSGGLLKDALPIRDRIFVSEHAHDELQKRGGVSTRLVGFFDLKGLAGRHRVFEVLWQQMPPPDDPEKTQITKQTK
jgi:class 3 adenylate cyclase